MKNAEVERGLFQRTLGSESLGGFSKTAIKVVATLLLLDLGIGSVQGLIEAIDQAKAAAALLYGAQAGIELGVAGKMIYSGVRSRNRSKTRT